MGLLFPITPRGIAGIQPSQNHPKTHCYAPRQELKHGAVAGPKHGDDRLAPRNVGMPCKREKEGAVRLSLVRGTAWADGQGPRCRTRDTEVRFLWGAAGGSWALQRLGQAATEVGKAGCRPYFPRTKVHRIPGWGFQRPFSDLKPAPRSRVARFGREGFGQEMRRLVWKHRSL